MRDAFVKTIYEIIQDNPQAYLMIGDLGAFLLRGVKKDFPERFMNMGVAEANMVGVAAGMALEGKMSFVYSINPFLAERSFEQIKNDVCYHNLNVKIVGVGAGVSYSIYGPTHHSIEDLGGLRALPNLTILCPADSQETVEVLRAAAKMAGPVYLRLTLVAPTLEIGNRTPFEIGRARIFREGKDVTIFSCGEVAKYGLKAAQILQTQGIDCRVVNFHTLKPFDVEAVVKAAQETKALVAIEEHNIIGGLGSAVSEVLAESKDAPKVPFKRLGFRDSFCQDYGSKDYLVQTYCVSPESIVMEVKKLLEV